MGFTFLSVCLSVCCSTIHTKCPTSTIRSAQLGDTEHIYAVVLPSAPSSPELSMFPKPTLCPPLHTHCPSPPPSPGTHRPTFRPYGSGCSRDLTERNHSAFALGVWLPSLPPAIGTLCHHPLLPALLLGWSRCLWCDPDGPGSDEPFVSPTWVQRAA